MTLRSARFALLALIPFQLNAVIISGIYVTATASSGVDAQQKAMDEAHRKAFEAFNNQTGLSLTPSDLATVIKSVSVNQEKANANSYSAVYDFEFDDNRLQKIISGESRSSTFSQDIEMVVAFEDLANWERRRKILEKHAHSVEVTSLGAKQATVRVIPKEDRDTFFQNVNKEMGITSHPGTL